MWRLVFLNKFKIYIKHIIHIPAMYNSILIKKKNTILWVLYNEFTKIKFPLTCESNKWSFDNETNSITIPTTKVSCRWGLFLKKFNLWVFTWDGIFFEKIKFNGKGFKITFKKKKKIIKIYIWTLSH